MFLMQSHKIFTHWHNNSEAQISNYDSEVQVNLSSPNKFYFILAGCKNWILFYRNSLASCLANKVLQIL